MIQIMKAPQKPKSIPVFSGLMYDMGTKSLKSGHQNGGNSDDMPKPVPPKRTVYQTASGARRIRHRRSITD